MSYGQVCSSLSCNGESLFEAYADVAPLLMKGEGNCADVAYFYCRSCRLTFGDAFLVKQWIF